MHANFELWKTQHSLEKAEYFFYCCQFGNSSTFEIAQEWRNTYGNIQSLFYFPYTPDMQNSLDHVIMKKSIVAQLPLDLFQQFELAGLYIPDLYTKLSYAIEAENLELIKYLFTLAPHSSLEHDVHYQLVLKSLGDAEHSLPHVCGRLAIRVKNLEILDLFLSGITEEKLVDYLLWAHIYNKPAAIEKLSHIYYERFNNKQLQDKLKDTYFSVYHDHLNYMTRYGKIDWKL